MSAIRGSIEATTNLKELAEQLKSLPENFAKSEVKKAQKAAWTRVLNEARAKAPVDTGILQENIILKTGYSKKKGVIFSVVGLKTTRKKYARSTRKRKGKSTYLVIDAHYARFVEFGTKHQDPQPFMRPAFDHNFREAFHDFSTELKDGLERRFARMAKQTIKRRIA